ncbi:MAG: QueT transporter family protein [candidate division Zixibacteria bacterium]|nr:QueT transporter family protein [candidate division Zixibacteria bacterium]
MKNNTIRFITRSGVIGALYAVFTIILYPISYGPIQVRISESLTILPFFTPAAIPGLWAGCLIANIFSNAGIYDIVIGSLLTGIAAYLTYLTGKVNKPFLAPLPPVIINAFGVSAYLQYFYEPPPITILGDISAYWLFVSSIAIGEIAACYLIGLPLLYIIRNSQLLNVFK